MAREQLTFEQQLIEDGRQRLLKVLDDRNRDMYNIEESEPEVYVKRKPEEMEEIKEKFTLIAEEGRKRNIEVYLNSSYPQKVFFRYIFFVPFTSI